MLIDPDYLYYLRRPHPSSDAYELRHARAGPSRLQDSIIEEAFEYFELYAPGSGRTYHLDILCWLERRHIRPSEHTFRLDVPFKS